MSDAVFQNEDVMRIRALVDEGLASGICEDEPEVVIKRIIAERRARRAKKTKS